MNTQEIDKLLTKQQTGAYVPSEEEQAVLDRIETTRESRPQDGLPRPGAGFDQFRLNPLGEMRNENITAEAAQAGWGNSRFDRAEFHPDEDLENKRANEQTAFNKILNGAAKGGVFALTTAAETTLGIINGLFEGIGEIGRQISTGDEFSMSEAIGKGVNNWTARTMADIQKLSEEWFPNYRTLEERSPEYQSQWLRHVFTANFIGDSFLKNFGFTVGALAGGAAWSKLINVGLKTLSAGNMLKGITAAASGDAETKALLTNTLKAVGEVGKDAATVVDAAKVPKMFERAAKGLNKLTTKHELFGSVIAAMGEGTMEGVMARNEFMDDWGERLRSEYIQSYSNLRDNIISELDGTDMIREVPVFDANGKIVDKKKELNDRGEKYVEARLAEEQKNLAADYAKKKQWLEEQGNRLAATTFLLNIPILTVSNTMQFGRMLSGGFKSSRSNLAKITGKILKDGEKIAADYAPATGNRAIRIAAKSAKLGGVEAAEEMAQGFVSSGAKKVADARLTSFNDDGYDRTVLSGLSADWLGTMMEGGGEYLADWKNWQEGFMGLVTGLVGVPGRRKWGGHRWNGGIAEAAREVNEEDQIAQNAAERLNNVVNSEKFQKAWKGYVRHKKYDAEMEDAVANDDHYAWATANDKQLVSDIMMFADAGRLNELKELVDYYADLSEQQAQEKGIPEQVANSENETDVQNNPSKAISKVKENAKEIKDAIQLYSEMFDNMRTIAPLTTSDAQLQEMIATSMNIKKMEQRFLSLFDKVMAGVGDYIRPLAMTDDEGEELQKEEDKKRRADEIHTMLTRIITNPGTGINYSTTQELMDSIFTMRLLEDSVKASKDETLKKDFEDMKKISNDRRAFLRKLVTLEKLDSAVYNEKAETPDKVADEVHKENANKALEGVQTFKDIKAKYESLDDKGKQKYLDTIMPKAKESQPVREFLAFKQKFDGFLNYVKKNGLQIDQPQNAMPVNANMVSTIVNEMFERAHGPEDLDTLPSTIFRVENQFIEDGAFQMPNPIPGLPPIKPTAATYNALKDGIRRAMKDYLAKQAATASANQGSSKPTVSAPPAGVTVNEPTGYDAAASGSNTPPPGKQNTHASPVQTPESKPQATTQTPPTESDNTADNEQVNISPVRTPEQEANDAIDAEAPIVDKKTEEEMRQENGKGREKVPYYRTSVPEIATGEAKKARRAIERHDRDARMEVDLSDFLDYLQHQINEAKQRLAEADEVGDRDGHNEAKRALRYWETQYEGYKDTWNALKDRGAFDEIVDIRKFDEVEFVIDPTFPKFKGDDQILLRNKRTGKIYSILSMQTSDYYGLHDLRHTILKEYGEKNDNPNDVFVFSKTSKVWAKQSGYIDYDFGGTPKDIREIPGAEALGDMPIMMVDRTGAASIVRGESVAIPYSFRSAADNKNAGRQGAMYFLVKTDLDSYAPIGITTGRFSSENKDADNPFFKDIRKAATKIANFFQNSGSDLEAENQGLKARVKELSELLDIHDVDFRIITSEGAQILQITTGKPNESAVGDTPTLFSKEMLTPEVLVDYLAGLNKHIQADTKRLDAMQESGLLQSNAKKLRPKGMDVYIDPWLGNEFGQLTDAQREAHAQESVQAEQQQDDMPVVSNADDNDADTDEYPVAVSRSSRSERRRRMASEGSQAQKETATESSVNWSSVSEETKSILTQQGYTEKLWNSLSPEAQQQKLKCITVG